MTIADLKLSISRQVDALDKHKLEAFYGVLINFVNEQKDISDWVKLSVKQKQGIFDAIDEMNAHKGIPDETVIAKFREKYSNA